MNFSGVITVQGAYKLSEDFAKPVSVCDFFL